MEEYIEITLALTALTCFLIGILFAVLLVQENPITLRVQLRALRLMLNDPAVGDETVKQVARRQVRRLENRLRVDDDE